jgi:hypothetical protein
MISCWVPYLTQIASGGVSLSFRSGREISSRDGGFARGFLPWPKWQEKSDKIKVLLVTFLENPKREDQKIRETQEVISHRPFWFRIFRIGKNTGVSDG